MVLAYRRILLKLSGEALKGHQDVELNASPHHAHPIQNNTLERIVREIATITQWGVQVGIVIGGGNWIRGSESADMKLNRVTADHMGMLATIMNALVLQDEFSKQNINTCIMSAIPISGLVAPFSYHQAERYLQNKTVLIFAGGTGHPLVSTDTAASLRSLEINAEILLKASSVEGIYSADPAKHSDAVLHEHITYQYALDNQLAVMDFTAFCLCRDHHLAIRVFNIHQPNALLKIMQGESIGTLVRD